MSAGTKQPRARATYVCTMGCTANCPCEVRASEVWWDEDELPSPRPGDGGEYVVEPGEPCAVFRVDADHPHPAEHVAIDADGILHRWRDGETACRRYRPCPSCDGADLSCEFTELLP